MERNIKTELDELVPIHITMYEDEKSEILREAKQQTTKGTRKPFSFKPAFISIAMLLIIGFFITPSIQKEFFTASPFTPQKVTIEGVEYSRLVASFFIDETNEIIFSDQSGIYSFNVGTQEKNQLIESLESEVIYDVAANERWLIWLELSENKLHILDRHTSEKRTMDDTFQPFVLLEEDSLFYISNTLTLNKLSVETLEETVVHKIGYEGSNSKPMIAEGKLLISEYEKLEGGQQVTTYFVYDIHTNEQLAKVTVPYEIAVDATLSDNKIYATLFNNGEYVILGYVDLIDGQFYKIETPPFETSAVYGKYVALTVPVKDSNTVKLYQLEDGQLVPLSTFNSIEERLVKPRFTSNGTLIVNGEGSDRSMYLVKTNE